MTAPCDCPTCGQSLPSDLSATPSPQDRSRGIDWENPEHPAVKLFVGFDVEGYVEEYEYCGEGGDYSPNEQERMLLVDAIYGVVANLHEELRKFIPSSRSPAPIMGGSDDE